MDKASYRIQILQLIYRPDRSPRELVQVAQGLEDYVFGNVPAQASATETPGEKSITKVKAQVIEASPGTRKNKSDNSGLLA